MFNTPFGFNGFNAFPGFQGQGFPGQGFQGSTPSWNQGWNQNWNQGWNSTPWSASNDWQGNAWNTPWGWNSQSFGGFGSPFAGFQGFSPWNQTSGQWTPSNWFNSPFASQFASQFGGQFGNQFPTPQTPFGFNWWNNEGPQTESGTPGFAGAPFGFNPFTGFNPAAATQAA